MAVVGFDPYFLSVAAPLPAPPSGMLVRELRFTHFMVLLRPDRRLAVVTGVNLDGAQLVDLDRGDDWHLDPRVPAAEQVGPEVYAGNDLDRGHLTRRRDPVWGDPTVAAQANLDTFSYVNAAPQAALFNQGETLWAGLEDYILLRAHSWMQRLSVFTAPVLADTDPIYRGVQIPRRFWKIAAWTTTTAEVDGGGTPTLAATGYVLDQSVQLDAVLAADTRTTAEPTPPEAPAAPEVVEPPPLGAYLTYQVPILDIATLTGLDLGPLPAADRLGTATPVPARTLKPTQVRTGFRWIRLQHLGDLRL